MKKNVMLKIAAVLLVAVLLSTCAISATFAKYTTGEKDVYEDSAKVAKWGVEVNTVATTDKDLFVKNYTDAISLTDDIIAPGTHNEVELEGAITGQPEVTGEVIYKVKIDLANFGDYKPLTFTVNGNDWTANATGEWVAVTAMPFEAGTDLAGEDFVLTIGWNWAIDGNDTEDTKLGNIAAGTVEGTRASVTISVKAEVVQTSSVA